LQLLHIAVSGLAEVGEGKRQQVSIGEPKNSESSHLRQRTTIHERRIAEMGIPVEVVVNGVVDTTVILTAVADVERRDPQVIDERRVIGSRSESAAPEVGAIARVLSYIGRTIPDS